MSAIVESIEYTAGSGLATIVALDDSGDVVRLHVDAGPFFRGAANAIEEGTVIEYEMTDYGTVSHIEVLS